MRPLLAPGHRWPRARPPLALSARCQRVPLVPQCGLPSRLGVWGGLGVCGEGREWAARAGECRAAKHGVGQGATEGRAGAAVTAPAGEGGQVNVAGPASWRPPRQKGYGAFAARGPRR